MDGASRWYIDGSELVAALGLVFVMSGVTLWWESILPTTMSIQAALYELVVHVLFGGIVLILGVHIERSELSRDERFAVMVWCFSGFLFLFLIAVWSGLGALFEGNVTAAFVSEVVVFGSMGGAFGVIAGVNHGRSARNRRLAERNEDQRETLVLLTRLLRHDIRNDMTAISGHAEILEEHVDEAGEASVEVIRRRSEAIIRLLQDTDTLVKTLGDDREFQPIDFSAVLREEVASVVDDHPAVSVESDIPDGLWVFADGLVHQLFSNLLGNAVAHNDPEELTIRIEATRRDGTIETVVADDGSGLPEEIRDHCFELGEQGPESEGDGLGLYLVSRLADVYDGSVDHEESEDGGAKFIIRLPTPE
ncbi:MAG: two-component system OmpR family sensor kinase [Natronomonas sp.]|jgi:two-component system OmpR family sensor kinase|uniref:sensor histidine kinase n=1 Tax=Natronomonas sp. TaxID=2184060 RepID=UPI003989D61B